MAGLDPAIQVGAQRNSANSVTAAFFAARSGGRGITPRMMEAGRKAVFDRMLDLDYLSQAPTAQGLDDVASSIFMAMSLAKPRDRSQIT
jgi:hypothetical protein